jgi:hypothetical protein
MGGPENRIPELEFVHMLEQVNGNVIEEALSIAR